MRVDSLDEAIDAAIAHPDAVIVTPAGDRFAPNGWRIGAAAGGATAAALADAQQRAEEAVAALAAADEAVAAARSGQTIARQIEADLTRRLDQNDARFIAASEGLAGALGQRRELQAELEGVDRSVAELTDHIGREQSRIGELEAVLPSLDSDEHAEAEAARARGEARAELEARAALLASRRRELEVRNAGLHERQQFLEARIAETERRLEADQEARAVAAERRVQIERSIAAIDRLAALVAAHRSVVEIEHDELAEHRRRQSDEVRGLTTALDSCRRAGPRRSVISTRPVRRRTVPSSRKPRRSCGSRRRSRHCDASSTSSRRSPKRAELPELPDGATPAGRVRELDRELRLLGPINPLALEEFNELQKRHTFLEEQLDDVRSTRRDLSRVIKAVDHEIQNVFAAAFADVSANFTELFGTAVPRWARQAQAHPSRTTC